MSKIRTIHHLPIIKQADLHYQIQKKNPKTQYLRRVMANTRCEYEFAGAYLALWKWDNSEPKTDFGNVFVAKAVSLARSVRERFLAGDIPVTHELRLYGEFRSICDIQQQVSSPSLSKNDSGSSFDNMSGGFKALKNIRSMVEKARKSA